MSITRRIEYDNPANYTYDSTKLKVENSRAELKVQRVQYEIDSYPFDSDIQPRGGYLQPSTNDTLPHSGGYVEINNNQAIGLLDKNAFPVINGEIEWISKCDIPPSPFVGIFNQGIGNSRIQIFYAYQSGTQKRLIVRIYDNVGNQAVQHIAVFNEGAVGVDHHFLLSYDSSTGANRLFIDGVLISNISVAPYTRDSADYSSVELAGLDRTTIPVYVKFLRVFSDTPNIGASSVATISDLPPAYDTGDYLIESKLPIKTDNIISLSDSINEPTNTSVGDIVKIESGYFWFDGSNWVPSNLTIAESNTDTEINANLASLNALLNGGQNILIASILKSTDGILTPYIDWEEVKYDFAVPNDSGLNKCKVYGIVFDNNGLPVEGAKVSVDGPDYFYTNTAVTPSTKVATITRKGETFTDANGEWSMDVVETATDLQTVDFIIEYKQGKKLIKTKFTGVTVPNQEVAALGDIVP